MTSQTGVFLARTAVFYHMSQFHSYCYIRSGHTRFTYRCLFIAFCASVFILSAHPTASGKAVGYVELVPPIYDSAYSYSNGLALVAREVNDTVLYGFLDRSGNEVIPIQYESAGPFSEELAPVCVAGKRGYINKSGEMVIDNVFDFALGFTEGLARVEISGKYGYIDSKGGFIIPAIYDDARAFTGGYAGVKVGGLWGVIGRDGNEIIPFLYLNVNTLNHDLVAIYSATGWNIMDMHGDTIVPFQYGFIDIFCEGLASVWVGNKQGFIDTTGNVVIPAEFDRVDRFNNGMAWVMQNRLIGFVDIAGTIALPIEYTSVSRFNEGYAFVQNANQSCLIDLTGRTITSLPRYDQVYDFHEGVAVFIKEGKRGFINTDGEEITPPVYDSADDVIEGISVIEANGKYGYISFIYYDESDVNTNYDEAVSFTMGSFFVTEGSHVLPKPPVQPVIINGRVMLPCRYLCEAILQGSVDYDEDSRMISANLSGHKVIMMIDDSNVIIDGETLTLSQAPILIDGHAMVPLRAFEKFVSSLTWIEESMQVLLVR